jgi:hypothetical protein
MSDLVCLVADKNMEAAADGLLSRPQALGIRPIDYTLIVHPRRDPGCFHEAPEFLKMYRATHAHALVLLDRSWDGAPASTGEKLQELLRVQLQQDGLADWAESIVIDPELEAWIFSDSPWVERCLGWSGQGLKAWLVDQKLWPATAAKPPDPKSAVEQVLYQVKKPRSSSIYRELARNVSVERCCDKAFLQFKAILRQWWPVASI